ncbi:MAG: RNA methyltransferase [Prolixibacteraceae bacterium]|nr:RNA methyltransferase [Prolixibacteraceae bacterium]
MAQRISKNRIKQLQSLAKKKHRDAQHLFIAEGEKIIRQLHEANFNIQTLVGTPALLDKFSSIDCEMLEAEPNEIRKISTLTTPREVLAVCTQPNTSIETLKLENELILALDDIQDPGNLGTIIRLASWFGIRQVVCSLHSADCFNPKVIQSSMGAIAHVALVYTELATFLEEARKRNCPVYGTFLDGQNIYTQKGLRHGIVVLGNEGNGISTIVARQIDQKLYIPNFAAGQQNVESLNVSMAAAIICSEFRRNAR